MEYRVKDIFIKFPDLDPDADPDLDPDLTDFSLKI